MRRVNYLMNIKKKLQSIFDEIEAVCDYGDSYDVVHVLDLAASAYATACQRGCDVTMPRLTSAHDAMRLAGQLLAWASAEPGRPLTVPEVATLLRVRPDKVLAWIRSGRLRGYNVAEKEGGRPKYRVNPADLEGFAQQRAVTQPAPKGRPAGRRRIPVPKWQA